MPRVLIGITGVALASVLMAGLASAAGTPEQKCQGAKNLAAGKYAACRQKAEKGLATTGDATKYGETISKCESKFALAWQKAIDVATVTCPDAPLVAAAYKTQIDEFCHNVATALNGGGLADCSGDLVTCTTDLATSHGSMATCNSNYSTCSGSLGSCNGSLSTCNSNYSSCSGSLTTCNASLGTCNTNYSTCSGSLATCNAGTAAAEDVLEGKTFSSSAGLGVTGVVAAGADLSGGNGLKTFTIPDGLYSSSKTATANDTNLIAENIRAGITVLGVTGTFGTCPSDMVPVGGLCIDKYESSAWDSPTGTTQYGASSADYPCTNNGQNCATDGTRIYARSVAGVTPSRYITWFQAQQACANVGKRLPTNAEWQQAVAGSPDPGADNGTTDCDSGPGPSLTGERSSCVSSAGAFDMVGNVWEWVADWVPSSTGCGAWSGSADYQCMAGASTTGDPSALFRGGSFGGGANDGPLALYVAPPNTSVYATVGFRCAR